MRTFFSLFFQICHMDGVCRLVFVLWPHSHVMCAMVQGHREGGTGGTLYRGP